MKPVKSSLNPYAASYVPLSKQVDNNRTAWSGASSERQQVTKQNHFQGEASPDFSIHGIEKLSENGTQKGQLVFGYHDSRTENSNGKTEKHDHSEVELAYLSVMFPGISDQSLADVYTVNEGDLDASIEMLHQLEVSPADVPQHSLEVAGDVSRFEYPDEGTSERPNQTTSDVSTMSSSCS